MKSFGFAIMRVLLSVDQLAMNLATTTSSIKIATRNEEIAALKLKLPV